MPTDNRKKSPSLFAVPEREASGDGSLPSEETHARRKKEESAPVCQLCFGTGLEVVPGKGARRCECRKQNSREKILEVARIPRRYSDRTLDNYIPESGNGAQVKAKMKAKELADNYHSLYKQQGRGLLFMGPAGVGKTHLAVAILHELIEKGVECLFYEYGALLKSIQDSYNPISQASELRILAPVYETEVLALDELGATMPTDWVRDTVAQIINRRYNDRKVTIFTTNFMDEIDYTNVVSHTRTNPLLDRVRNERAALLAEEPRNEDERRVLDQRLAENRQREKQIIFDTEMTPDKRIQRMTKLEERIGVSMRSRLYEMCDTIIMQGADYRPKLRRNNR